MPGTLGWVIVIVILAGGLWYLKKHTHVLDKFFPGSTPAATGGLSTQDAGTVGYALGRIENCVPVCQAKGNSSSECQKCVDSMLK